MQRNNNFDLVRLVLAWMVVASHCYNLSQAPALWALSLLHSRIAVEGFFAISGCLIVASWDRSESALDYFRRRARRILPAYWLAIAFSLLLGSMLTTLPLHVFWVNRTTWKYLAANLVFMNFLQPDLPGVFRTNPVSAMNGALWTIKIEVAFYLLVPALVWLIRKSNPLLVLSAVFFASAGYQIVLRASGHDNLATQLPGQLLFFTVGVAAYYYPSYLQHHRFWMWGIAVVCTIGALLTRWTLLDGIGIPLLVLCLALLTPSCRGLTRYGDFSYGTYVLHFPLIQMAVALGLFAWNPFGAVLFVAVMVAVLAAGSWFLVERRFLGAVRVQQRETVAAGSVG